MAGDRPHERSSGYGIRSVSIDREHGFVDAFAFALGTARRAVDEVVEPREAALAALRWCDEQLLVGGLEGFSEVFDV